MRCVIAKFEANSVTRRMRMTLRAIVVSWSVEHEINFRHLCRDLSRLLAVGMHRIYSNDAEDLLNEAKDMRADAANDE